MTGTIAPFVFQQEFDNNGDPLNGGLLYTYVAGTTTPLDTYTDSTLATPNANPIVLDSAGRYAMFLSPVSYKFVLKTSAGVTVKTVDGISAVPLTNVNLAISGTAGEDLAINDAVYMSDGSGSLTAGYWYKTDSDNTYSSTAAKQYGFSPAAVVTGETGSFVLRGRITGLSSLTAGSVYYASATAGAITSSAPANGLPLGAADSTTSLIVPASFPDASATVSGIVNTTTQTFGGAKTLTSAVLTTPSVSNPTITGGGSWTGSPSLASPAYTALPTGIGALVSSFAASSVTVNNSTTLVNVTGLSFAVAATASYQFLFMMFGIAQATATWKMTLTGPAAPTAIRYGVTNGITSAGMSTAFSSSMALAPAGNANVPIILTGYLINGANAGTVQFQFAQNAADATDTIIYAHSSVMAWRVA